MKKTVLFVALVFIGLFVEAQCVPDGSLSAPGLYPPAGSTTDTTAIILPDAIVNQAVSFVTQVVVLNDTSVSLGGISFNVPVDSLGIINVSGIPAGMSSSCNVPNCTWPGGGNGCIELSGTPTTTGTFEIIATSRTRIVFGALLDTSVLTPFVFKLNVVAAASIFENRPIEFRADPNPASDFVDIRINRENENLEYQIIDLLGRTIKQGNFSPLDGHYRLGVSDLKNGTYLIQVGNAEGRMSRRLLIAR